MKKTLNKINRQALYASLAYTLLIGMLIYLLTTGDYREFVVPRISPFLWATVVLLTLFLLNSLSVIFQRKHHNNYKQYLPLLILFLLLIFIKSQDMNKLQMAALSKTNHAQNAQSHYKNWQTPKKTTETPKQAMPSNIEDISKEQLTKHTDTEAKRTIIAAMKIPATSNPIQENLLTADDIIFDEIDAEINDQSATTQIQVHKELGSTTEPIIINPDDFYDKLINISSNIEMYIGRRIIVDGFIIRDKNLYTEGDFLVARMAMTCCIADIRPLGFVSFYDEATKYPDGTWVHIEGTLQKTNFYGMPQAAIKIEKIKTREPIPGYIYP